MWIFEDYTPRKNNWDGTCNSANGMAGADHPLESFTAWGNLRGCEMSMGDGVHMKGFVAADNEISGLALKENHRTDNYEVDSTSFVDSVVIGHTGESAGKLTGTICCIMFMVQALQCYLF